METGAKSCDPNDAHGLWSKFAGYSTLHGLHFLFDASSRIRRYVWFVLLCSAMALFLCSSFMGWEKFNEHDIYISTKFREDNSFEFPSVTICNNNMLKKSKILGDDGQRYLDLTDFNLMSEWANISRQMNNSFNIEDDVLKNGHQLNDMAQTVVFKNAPLNLTHFGKYFDGRTGLCHTFNSNGTYKFSKVGSSFGLNLLLDAEPEEYYGIYSRESGIGFKIMVHDKIEQPSPELYGIDIPTGFATNIKIKKKEYHKLPEPYPTKCGEKKLLTSDVYTSSACYKEHYATLTAAGCSCKMFGLPSVGEESKRLCSATEVTECVYPLLSNSDGLDSVGCPSPCLIVHYKTDTSMSRYPSESAWQIYQEKYKTLHDSSTLKDLSFRDWFRGRFAFVKVFFGTKVTEEIREVPAYDLSDFGANLGGNMGLFLGCSVLTVVEFIDVLVQLIIKWRSKTKVTAFTVDQQRPSS